MQPRPIYSYFVVALISLLIGAVGVYVFDPYLPNNVSNVKKGYSTGFAAARAIVEQSPVGSAFRTPSDVRVISGIVSAVGNDSFTLQTSSNDPFQSEALKTRKVMVATTTTILAVIQNMPADLSQAAFASLKNGTTGATTRSLTSATSTATFSSLVVGSTVSVFAGENIKDAQTFTATGIQVFIEKK